MQWDRRRSLKRRGVVGIKSGRVEDKDERGATEELGWEGVGQAGGRQGEIERPRAQTRAHGKGGGVA